MPFIILAYTGVNLKTNYYAQEVANNLGFWGDSVVLFPIVSTVSAAFLIGVNAVLINWLFNLHDFLERNVYMPALLYVVLMSFFHSCYGLDGLLISHTAIIILLFEIFKLNQNIDGRKHVFNAAFFGGIAASFHPPMVAFLPFLMFMIWTIRPFIFREFMLAILGFSIPLLYALIYLWYSGHAIELKILEQTTDYENKQTDFLIMAVLFTLLFLLSLIGIRARLIKSSIRLKKLINILFWWTLVGVSFGVIDFILFRQIERFSFLMIPLSFFLTFSFTHKTFGVIASILFYLTLAYSFVKFFM